MNIGIDIGATKILGIVFDQSRNIIVKISQKNTPDSKDEFMKAIEDMLKFLSGGQAIQNIGAGLPGECMEGKCFLPNLPFLNYLDENFLKDIVAKLFPRNIGVYLNNDTKLFALAEAVLGKGKDCRYVFGITLGSGLGGGIVLDKKIYGGSHNVAGEIGHSIINFDGLEARVLEDATSMKFFKNKGVGDIKLLAEDARKGGKEALEMFNEYGKNIGMLIVGITNVLDPDIIVFGGGLSETSDLFLDKAISEAEKLLIYRNKVNVEKGRFAHEGVAVGAAIFCDFN